MMGSSHSLSAAGLAMTGLNAYALTTGNPVAPVTMAMTTFVIAGNALVPDFDSYSSTAVKSFSFVGRGIYYVVNAVSMLWYNLTKTRRDDDIENGHRTFLHTLFAAILAGLATFWLTGLGGTTEVLGKTFTNGQLASLIILACSIHLAVAGLFDKKISNIRRSALGLSALGLLAVALVVTFFVAQALPADLDTRWLSVCVTFGFIAHHLGDLPTKKGLAWFAPFIKIRGKRWYDLALPSALRFKAGGDFEKKALIPVFYFIVLANLVLYFSLWIIM